MTKASARTHSNALLAALLHDLRRLDDKGDVGHAQRGAKWASSHWQEIVTYFDLGENEVDRDEVITAISLHETPYANLAQAAYGKHKICADILKTADALDRYRLPKLKWWPNAEFIFLQPSSELSAFAFDLVSRSESQHISGIDSAESIWNSLGELCHAD